MPSRAAARASRRLGRHRPRRLRGVADDRPRGGATAAADHPPLHRREVLRLVDEHMGERVVLDAVGRRRPAAAAGAVLALHRGGQLLDVAAQEVVELVILLRARRHVAERVAQLVDQRHVLHRRGRLLGPGLRQQPLVLAGEHALGDPGQEVGVAQPAQHRGRVERRPPLDHEVDERLVGQHLVVERLAATLATALAAHLPPHHVEQRRCDPRDLTVAAALPHQLATQLAELLAVHHDHVVAPEDPELPRRPGHLLARRTPHQLGHPGRSLHIGDGRLVVARRADAVDDLAERPQRNGRLAEGRQHALDVAHEDAAGADDEHAAGLVTTAVGVEEVRRAVQCDDRLARPGPPEMDVTPRDGARIARSCSAWIVATIECIERSRARESCAISAPSPTIGRSVSASASSSSSSTLTTYRRCAARGGVRRSSGRPPSPGRRPPPRARASRSAESRGCRRADRCGRRSADRCRARAEVQSPNTSPSWAASSWAIRFAAWNTMASRSTSPPS